MTLHWPFWRRHLTSRGGGSRDRGSTTVIAGGLPLEGRSLDRSLLWQQSALAVLGTTARLPLDVVGSAASERQQNQVLLTDSCDNFALNRRLRRSSGINCWRTTVGRAWPLAGATQVCSLGNFGGRLKQHRRSSSGLRLGVAGAAAAVQQQRQQRKIGATIVGEIIKLESNKHRCVIGERCSLGTLADLWTSLEGLLLYRRGSKDLH